MLNSQRLRASINWHLFRDKTADMIEDLIAQVPEFNDLMRMPNCPTRPHNVLPIGLSSCPRRRVKAVDRVSASDLARFYLQKKRRLPSSSHCCQETVPFGLSFEATARLADILAKSVEAGMCLVPCRRYQPTYTCNEGVPGAPVKRAKYSGISSDTNAGTKHSMIGEAVVNKDFVPRNNLIRP